MYIDGTVRDRPPWYVITTKTLLCVRDIHTDLGHISRRRGSGDDDDDDDDEMMQPPPRYQHCSTWHRKKENKSFLDVPYAPSVYLTLV